MWVNLYTKTEFILGEKRQLSRQRSSSTNGVCSCFTAYKTILKVNNTWQLTEKLDFILPNSSTTDAIESRLLKYHGLALLHRQSLYALKRYFLTHP